MNKSQLTFCALAFLAFAACSKQGFLDQTQSSDLNEEWSCYL